MSAHRLNRRELLAGAAALGTVGAAARAAPAQRPHYVVQITLTGGYDSVLTVDPKLPSQVKGLIECGYGADERLQGQSRLYGPMMKELMPVEADLCLVHGVRVDTVAHPLGLLSLTRGGVARGDASTPIGNVVGALLPGTAPIPHLCLGHGDLLGEVNPGASELVTLTPQLADRLLAQPPSRYAPPAFSAAVEGGDDAAAARLFGARGWELEEQRRAARQALVLRQLLAGARRGQPTRDEDDTSYLGLQLHLALEALKQDTARYVSVGSPALWFDTHSSNLAEQRRLLPMSLRHLARFIQKLKTERNAHGTLLSQTTVLVGSEVGRFPRLNLTGGKDHWPENSWMLLGKGIRGAPGGLTFGATDERFRSVPVDFQTGSTTSGARQALYVDSLFATLLAVVGASPQDHGYHKDSVLEFIREGFGKTA